MRLLVVDDDPDVRAALVVALEGDYDVVTAPDALVVVPLLDRFRFDAVFAAADAEGVVGALRARRHFVPVVIAAERDDAAAIARRVHATGFLKKPYSLAELELKLSVAFGGRYSQLGG